MSVLMSIGLGSPSPAGTAGFRPAGERAQAGWQRSESRAVPLNRSSRLLRRRRLGASGAVTAAPTTVTAPATGLAVTVSPSGAYAITARDPGWTFAGDTQHSLAHLTMHAGHDGIGAYRVIRFAYQSDPDVVMSIRLYEQRPIVLFSHTIHPSSGAPGPFPALKTYPRLPYAMSYAGRFAAYRFDLGGTDGPWTLFDAHDDAYLLSPASTFMAARLSHAGGILAGVLDPRIALPKGPLTTSTLLVLGHGIGHTIATWGRALAGLYGKARVADDGETDLKYLGYWTDHGAAYYYTFDPERGYAGTLLAIRDQYRALGLPLGYMQLDSWWYPKGPAADWRDLPGGAYTYDAATALFPAGLGAFQRRLGLPLVVHARWLDPASPYRARYTVSGNVPVDPRFWRMLARQLRAAGVVTYEQDWLGGPARAAPVLADQNAFLDGMARAMGAAGLDVQYCMPLPRDILQSVLYGNVRTVRVSDDRFAPRRWTQFLYGAPLASALGLWPWTDVMLSHERANLLLATLSGGPVGVGDALGTIDRDNLGRVVRADGVIVKPDAPLAPLDAVYLSDARRRPGPMVAAAYSRHGPLSAAYVFAYARGGAGKASYTPAALGFRGRIYVYDALTRHGGVHDARRPVPIAVTAAGYAYHVVVPIGPSDIAFLGDEDKFASLGRQRIAGLRDDGAVQATVLFARDERAVTLRGYAPTRPTIRVLAGSAVTVSYTPGTGIFTARVTPGPGERAIVRLTLKHQA